VITIDPGYSAASGGCACAWFDAGRLGDAWFERPEQWRDCRRIASDIIVEQPQQDGRSWAIPPAVLMRLSWDGALLAGLYAGACGARVTAVTPSAWKGSIAKPVQHRRVWSVLDAVERAVLGGDAVGLAIDAACRKGALDRWGKPGVRYYPASFQTHNLLDAVAMGVLRLGRVKGVQACATSRRS
jgi:hypothetical protein